VCVNNNLFSKVFGVGIVRNEAVLSLGYRAIVTDDLDERCGMLFPWRNPEIGTLDRYTSRRGVNEYLYISSVLRNGDNIFRAIYVNG
jgi:hypothetical protein